jgi:hypothetical protein
MCLSVSRSSDVVTVLCHTLDTSIGDYELLAILASSASVIKRKA